MLNNNRLFHLNNEPKIKVLEPYPPYSELDSINFDVIIAFSEPLLSHYLLPVNCPRITYYKGIGTSESDKVRFLANTTADYIIAIESNWYTVIQRSTLFCYEMPANQFTLHDAGRGIYISSNPVAPLSVRPIYNILEELTKRNVEIRFMPSINKLVESVMGSSLNYLFPRTQPTTKHSANKLFSWKK